MLEHAKPVESRPVADDRGSVCADHEIDPTPRSLLSTRDPDDWYVNFSSGSWIGRYGRHRPAEIEFWLIEADRLLPPM